MVRTVKPKARETPTKPMPRFGNPAARTAAPQPPNTSQKVPKTSAAIRRDISMIAPHPLLVATRFQFRRIGRKEQISAQSSSGIPKLNTVIPDKRLQLFPCDH